METPEWWLNLAPHLSIANRSKGTIDTPTVAENLVTTLQTVLDREGYLHLPKTQDPQHIANLGKAVDLLVRQGLPPVFLFVYDEAWFAFYRLHHVVHAALGATYLVLPDFWAWFVDPRNGGAGWRPHRDKGHRALFIDRRPRSLTVWIPITAATPLNGCMYLVPAHRDPTYGTMDDQNYLFEYPDIRALPGQSGDSFIWNQAVLHWGARSSEMGKEPRISMALEFQRADVEPFNTPFFQPLTLLSFEQRLALISKQIYQYRHMYNVSAAMLAFVERWLPRLPTLSRVG